ncbi:SDR family NAD(P)-dependent oxidoreductase [Phycisphaerales bacterium AB-hyl4]|uniref:SDR family NAD(P)-dependent oxidoreductase n=1 Tax=Natronomicrosphaera hydrolytica TaxID=3242702 RepID=A0ABV4U7H4_9BACT
MSSDIASDTSKQAPLAIVTGATGGIGACVARRLSGRGYRVALLGRNMARLAELEGELATGPGCVSLAVDLSQREARADALAGLLSEHGPAEVLVNNAGYNTYQRFAEMSAEAYADITEVNYNAAVELTRMVLPTMLERRRGWVVNVASVSTRMGPWGHSGYAAAKSALIAMTQSLAAEHAGSGVHFTYVSPGIVDTGYYSGPTMGGLWRSVRKHAISPDRVAIGIERLLDRPRLALSVPAHYRVLDWIVALSPALGHRLVASQSRPNGKAAPARGDG